MEANVKERNHQVARVIGTACTMRHVTFSVEIATTFAQEDNLVASMPSVEERTIDQLALVLLATREILVSTVSLSRSVEWTSLVLAI